MLWLCLTVGFRREEDWLGFEMLVLCLLLLLFSYKEVVMCFELRSIASSYSIQLLLSEPGHFCLGVSFPAIVHWKIVDTPSVGMIGLHKCLEPISLVQADLISVSCDDHRSWLQDLPLAIVCCQAAIFVHSHWASL